MRYNVAMLATTGLTAKQEAFCQGLIAGLSQVDAYVQAGYSDAQDRDSLYVNASQLANDAKIVRRLRELQGQLDDKTIGTLRERRECLTEIYRDKTVKPRDRIAAIHTHNLTDRVYSMGGDTHLSITITYDGSKALPQTVEGEYNELPSPSSPALPASQDDITT